MADMPKVDPKPRLLTGLVSAAFILKGGGFIVVNRGEPIPDVSELADGQLEHKEKAGAFGPAPATDWAALADVGTVPGPDNAPGRAEAAAQSMETATTPSATTPSPGPSGV
jgi:hypothetical protein